MNLNDAPARVREFWKRHDPQWQQAHRFYEPFQLGLTQTDADFGARLLLDGRKTATSSMLMEYEIAGRELPAAGGLSVLLDGRYVPVCIVESTAVEIMPFEQVDAAFCAAYAEGDGTVEGWRALTWSVYEVQCQALGRVPSMDMPLVCEHMRVIYPETMSLRRRAIETMDAGCASSVHTRH